MKNWIIIFNVYLGLNSASPLYGSTKDELKKVIALQQASITNLQNELASMKTQIKNLTDIEIENIKNKQKALSEKADKAYIPGKNPICKYVKHNNGRNCKGGYKYVGALGRVFVGGAGYNFASGPVDVDLCCR